MTGGLVHLWVIMEVTSTSQQSSIFTWIGKNIRRQKEKLCWSIPIRVDFKSISADTITKSSHPEKKDHKQQAIILHLQQNLRKTCDSEPTASRTMIHACILMKMLHWTSFVKEEEQCNNSQSKLIISRLKPSDNNHTAVSAMHLSCCWSGKAPKIHIALPLNLDGIVSLSSVLFAGLL